MATVTVRVPTPLRSFTGGKAVVEAQGGDVGEVVRSLGDRHQGFGERVLDAEGEPRSFVNVFLGEENIRSLAGLQTPVHEGDVLSIIPAVAGGRP
jgi:molybdopterin converting factor small subunit